MYLLYSGRIFFCARRKLVFSGLVLTVFYRAVNIYFSIYWHFRRIYGLGFIEVILNGTLLWEFNDFWINLRFFLNCEDQDVEGKRSISRWEGIAFINSVTNEEKEKLEEIALWTKLSLVPKDVQCVIVKDSLITIVKIHQKFKILTAVIDPVKNSPVK